MGEPKKYADESSGEVAVDVPPCPVSRDKAPIGQDETGHRRVKKDRKVQIDKPHLPPQLYATACG